MMKPDRASAAVGCGCGSSDHLLHSIRHRGAFLRLCTACVLRFHLGSFCPVCLHLFDRSPPSNSIQCSKCPSFSHSACVRRATAPSYVCSCCVNPNYLVIDFRALDLKSAKALVAAAQIASLSMSRAAAAARFEAERKARESAVARKRAKEALDRVTLVALRRKESQTWKGVSPESPDASVETQKRIHVRKLGGGPKISALSNLGIQETGKLAGMQGKDRPEEEVGGFISPAVS
ncbi:hypothetical protein ACLOJK_022065 [Asimina triloba]